MLQASCPPNYNSSALNPLKDKLARGEVVASMTVRLVSSVEIVRIAKTAGFDALYIDFEHSAFSIQTASQISVMALEAGIPALVRVPARTPEYISRVLDGGRARRHRPRGAHRCGS